MLAKEFEEKYDMDDITEGLSRNTTLDTVITWSLFIIIWFTIVVYWEQTVIFTVVVIFMTCLIGGTYIYMKLKKQREIINTNNFLDLTIFCIDKDISCQYIFDKYEILKDGEWIYVNDMFILDTTELFTDGYDIHESIFSFVDDVAVLTKYGLDKAPCVYIITTYHGEYKLNRKLIPILMLRDTGPILMSLSK